MSYASQQDLIDRFGTDELLQLTDRANVGAVDATVVARALGDADAEIDGYLTSRYSVPLSSTPPMLTRLACDIARYQLYADRVTDQVTQRYKDAVRLLVSLANGTVQLGVASGQAAPAVTGSVAIKADPRTFNASSLGDY